MGGLCSDMVMGHACRSGQLTSPEQGEVGSAGVKPPQLRGEGRGQRIGCLSLGPGIVFKAPENT